MNSKSYIIAVDIELTAPMTISAAEKGRYDFDRGQFVYGEQGVMCSLTRKQSLFGSNEKVPVIPSTTISGRLRRAAAERIFDSWIARDITCSPDVANMMLTGAATTELKAPTIESRMACRNDAFMRIFGGSTFMEHADSVISIGWPIIAKTAKFHMSEPLLPAMDEASEEKKTHLTEVMAIVKKDDVQDMTVKNQHALIGEAALAKYFNNLADNKSKRSAAKDAGGEDSGKTALRTFNGFEVVRTGTRFALRVKVGSPSRAHLGLMLLAMQSVLREGTFGGKVAKGLGRFSVEASRLIEVDEEIRQSNVVAKLFDGRDTGFALVDNEVVNQAFDAAQDYIQTADAAFFEAIANGNTSFFDAKKAA